jgi:hypothetical protein
VVGLRGGGFEGASAGGRGGGGCECAGGRGMGRVTGPSRGGVPTSL